MGGGVERGSEGQKFQKGSLFYSNEIFFEFIKLSSTLIAGHLTFDDGLEICRMNF